MKLTLQNVTNEQVKVALGGKPAYDFVVTTSDGEGVWKWKCGRITLDVLGNETLDPGEKAVKWVKLHIMCGVQSNIITAADATASMSADAPYLPGFVAATAENFRIRDISADMAYSSRNLHAVDDVGGIPYIPFKTGAVAKPKRAKADPLWAQMYHHFTLRQADFNRHYHLRSNVETCFHMIKAKFGDKVRAKSDTAMVNETLMKVLCHNICVLVRTMYALGITPVFDEGTFASETPLDAKVLVA